MPMFYFPTYYLRKRVEQAGDRRTDRLPLERVNPHAVARGALSAVVYLKIKRAADIVFVLLCAPMLLILMAFSATAILVTMGRPILFTQERVGLNGQAFKIFKLRTMQPELSPCMHETATLANDQRITCVGKFLRRFHLDELPQLWNVLRGEMTLIGPRPEQVHLVAKYRSTIPYFDLRHTVRPGLSGWAQVRFGYAADLDETRNKVEYDLYYIEHLSLSMDVRILFLTFAVYFDPGHVR
jgi:lipopolysaccharide/colanic/teichoic acid biosynthesis glycosyltransferase